jgi:glycoside/pentoside/hexuronide:cation symporter, GPH family
MVAVGFELNWIQIYYLSFASEVLLIAPAATGLVIGFSKLWDALSDPLAGYWSDRTRTRFGRRRPWIGAAALPFAAFSFALWSPPAGLGAPAATAWFAICVLGVYTAYTACTIPHLSLGAELTPDSHERTRIFGAREIGDKLGLFGALAAIFWLDRAADPRAAAVGIAGGAAVFALASWLLAAARLQEGTENVGRGPGSARSTVRDVWRNGQARILIFVVFIEQLGFAAVGSLLPFASEYVLRTPGYTSYYLSAFAVLIFLSIPFWIRLSGRLGKRRVWVMGLLIKSAGFAVVSLVPAGAATLAFVAIGALGFAHGCSSVLPASMLADLVDRDELASGERKGGAYFAASNLAAKAAMGVALLVNGVGLDLAGFTPGATQSTAVIWTIRALAAGLPCLLQLVAAFVFRSFSFGEVEHARVRAALARR